MFRQISPVKRLIALVAAAAAALAVVASANALPGYSLPNPTCAGWVYGWPGSVQQLFPKYFMPRAGLTTDKIFYSADLYRWNGSSWVAWDTSTPWVWFRVDQYGRPVYTNSAIYWNNSTGQPAAYSTAAYMAFSDVYEALQWNAFQWTNTVVGYYAVKHYFAWGSLSNTHYSQWSTYCYVAPDPTG